MIPPYPPLASAFSSRTVALTAVPLTAATTASAKAAGGRSPGAVLTRSRVVATPVASASARAAAARTAFSRGLAPRTVTAATGGLPSFAVRPRCRVNAYAPISAPSATAPTAAGSAAGSAMATLAVPPSSRVAAPAARRRTSSSYADRPVGGAPRPVRAMTGAETAPPDGIRTSWSGLPVTPSAARDFDRLVRSARGRSGAPRPAASTGPSGPALTPRTRTSAVMSAGDRSLIRRVVTSAIVGGVADIGRFGGWPT